MFDLIGDNPIRFILALGIGVATAWWIWAGRKAHSAAEGPVQDTKPAPPPPPPPTEPEPAVEPIAAASVAATAIAGADDAEPKPKIAAAVGADDDLTKINGIGPKLCALCNSLGVRRFDQIAAWSDGDVAEVDTYLASFKGRIARDSWVDQAKLLAVENFDEWQAKFGYKSK